MDPSVVGALPGTGHLAAFLVASLAMLLTPGPAVMYIVARGIGQGRREGLASATAIGAGNLVHALATTGTLYLGLGLTAALAERPA